MKNRIIYILLSVISVLAIMISTGAVAAFADEEPTQETPANEFINTDAKVYIDSSLDRMFDDQTLDKTKFKNIGTSGGAKLYMYHDTNNVIVFAIENEDGSVVYSAPAGCTQLSNGEQIAELTSHAVVNYTDTIGVSQKVSTSAAIMAGKYDIEYIENGVRITYDFADTKKGQGFKMPMNFIIKDGHFDVSVELNSIDVYADVDSKIMSISIMPYFGCAEYSSTGRQEEGYMFVPDGSGALIDNDFTALDGGVKYYSTYVYGRDSSLSISNKLGYTEATTLPTFGSKVEDKAWVGVIETGDAVSMVKAVSARENFPFTQNYCEILVNKSDVFQSKTSYNIQDYRQTGLESTDLEAATVRYYTLSGDDADYVGMAKSYREYLIEKGTRSDLDSDLPFYADVLGAFQKTESVFGFVTNVTKTATTYKEAQSIITELSDSGIENINLRYTGWMKGGVETSIVTNSKHESKLGKKQDLIDLNKMIEAQGGTMFLEIELVEMYKTKFGWSANKMAVRNILNNHATQFAYARSTGMPIEDYTFYLCRPDFFMTQVKKFFEDFSSYGVKGISAGTLGSANYSDLNNSAKYARDAQQVNTAMVEALATIETNVGESGKVMVNSGNASMIPYTDVIVGAPMYSNGYEMVSTDVPFLQIALHGLVTYTETAHNLCNDPQTQFLRQLETGTVPYYLFTKEESSVFLNTRLNYIYSSQIDTWKETAIADYKTLASVLNGYCNKPIDDHIIMFFNNNIRATIYGEGNDKMVVLVNYGAEYDFGGVKLDAMGFECLSVSEFESAMATATATAEAEAAREAEERAAAEKEAAERFENENNTEGNGEENPDAPSTDDNGGEVQ